MDFDECLSAIGGFGVYQKIVIYLVLLPAALPCAFHAYNQIFMGVKPENWCRMNDVEDANASLHFVNNLSVSVEAISSPSRCSVLDLNYTGDTLVSDKDTITHCKYGWVSDSSTFERTVVTEWNLVCDKEHYTTISLMLFGAGGLIGTLLFGYIQDFLGRRPAFFIYILIETVFSIASIFANTFIVWTILRFGVGFTIPAILGTPYVLSVELVGPEKRAFCTVLINIIYSVGLVALSAIAYFFREWRQLTLATTLPFILFFFYWWVMPESPRWLVANGKFDRAEKIMRKIAQVNGKNWSSEYVDVLKLSYEEAQKRSQRDGRYGVTHLFKYPKLRLNTIIITFVWFTNTAVYVGLSYYSPNLGGDEFFNFFLSGVVELPTYIFLLQAIERGGRRLTLCISMVVGGFACLGTLALENVPTALIIFYCVGKMGISCSFVVLPLLASEIYPTVVRGIGISFSSVIGQIGPIIIPLINYLGKDWMILPLLIMGIISVLGGILSFFLPETLNLHLPQNLKDGEKHSSKA